MKKLIICIGVLALSAGNAFGWGFGPGGGGGGGASSIAQLSDWPAAVSATEVGYLDGVTSAIQTQLGNKQTADADLTTWAGITPGANVGTALAVAVGSAGAVVTNGGALGTPSSGTLTNATGLPISGITGLGTGVGTALAINTGSAGAPVLYNGALGTPSSGTLTNCTFPTLNQNTTGSAATLTTARNIGDASFNGSAAITADAMLDNEDISPTAGTWDLSALTALTLPSFTGGSTTPGVTFNDTDAAATGTATLSVDALTAGQDSILQIRVDDSAGEDTVYIEVDGVAEDVEINKPLALSANSVTTTGIITGGAPTPVIDDPDNFAANFTGSNLYGGTFIANAAGTAALPNPAVGMNFTYVMEGANANIIDPLTTGTADTIYMNGLAAAQDENITSSTSGAICTFQYRSADAWMATCNGFAEASPP